MPSFFLYLFFISSYFLHLPSRFPFLGEIRFDFILMIIILILILIEKDRLSNRFKDLNTNRFLIYLIVYILFSIPLVEWPGSVIRYGLENFSKVVFFFFFTIAIVDTTIKLKVFIAIFLLCQMFRIVEPAYLHYTAGYWGDIAYSHVGGIQHSLNRLSGAPHDIVNPNQLAWVIVNTIPFMYYLVWRAGKTSKILFLSAIPIFIYTLLLTGSRSGFLSLIIVIVSMVMLSQKKIKEGVVVWAIIIIPSAMIAMAYLSPDFKERYFSLIDPSAAGYDTAMGRVHGVVKGLSTIANKPFVGHGLGTSREVAANFLSGRAQIAHNLYTEILQELGIIGFIIFILFIAAIFKSLIQAKRLLIQMPSKAPVLINLATAVQAWIIMDLFYSLSCFGLNSWEWYFFGGVASVCLNLAKEEHAMENQKREGFAEPPILSMQSANVSS